MTDRTCPDRALAALLELSSSESEDSLGGEQTPPDHMLPTLEQRVNIFLRVLHGPESTISPQQRALARDHILTAMAVDLAEDLPSPEPGGDPHFHPVINFTFHRHLSVFVDTVAAAMRWTLNNSASYAALLLDHLRLPIRTSRMVPIVAVLVLFLTGSAVWLFSSAEDAEDYELGSANPESIRAGSETFVVQILAGRSDADVRTAYGAVQTKFPAILGDRLPLVRRVDLGANNIEYRAELGPYDSFEKARDICSKLSETNTPCTVVRQ